ncbi:MAG: glycosyltransferase, partial [Verrucomicrobia bacterium]|nr:glycosyltransferase [Verrucomicrobiota bacterium]
GLDLEAFQPRGAEPAEPRILSVGRLVEKKGFSDLIGACQILKQRNVRFNCELVGTGALSSVLKEEIRRRGVADRIQMIGPLPQETLRAHYHGASVFVLPCRPAGDGDRDILPNVIKEALAVGVPVVTTRLEGMDELIKDGVNGLLAAPGDAPGLADRIELLLGDSQLRHRLAAQGRKAVEARFDRQANVAQLRNLLERALSQAVAPAAAPQTWFTPHEANCLR